ncbi:MAG: AAA family ATPase [Candidatus Limnocylindria bacterium]
MASEDLVGREQILRELYERVYVQGNPIVLSGPRQTGKTSVIADLLRRVRTAGGWGVRVDCSRATSSDDFAELVAAETYAEAAGQREAFAKLGDLLRNMPRPLLYHADSDLALTFHAPDRPVPVGQKLATALGLADRLAEEKKVRAVVVYDEFPTLRRIKDTLYDQIRAELQHANKNTAYVYMGSEVGVLATLFKDRRRMAFRLGTTIQLPPPSVSEWATYIERRFRELGLPVATGEAQRLITFTGGHPRDLMEACEHLLTLRTLDTATPQAIELAQEKTYWGLERNFELLWELLDEPKGTRETAGRIATGQRVYGRGRDAMSVKRSVDKLIDEGIVRKIARGQFEFTEPLFGEYVRRSHARR